MGKCLGNLFENNPPFAIDASNVNLTLFTISVDVHRTKHAVILKPYILTNIRLYDHISSISLHHGERVIGWAFFWSVTRKAWRIDWLQSSRIHLSQIFSLVPDYQQHWAFSVNNTQVIAVWTGGGIWEYRQSNISFFVLASSKKIWSWFPKYMQIF